MATYAFAKSACQEFYSYSPKFTSELPPHVLEVLENALHEELNTYVKLGRYLFVKSFAIFGPLELQKWWHSQGSLTVSSFGVETKKADINARHLAQGITEIVNREHHIDLVARGVCLGGVSGLNSACSFFAGLGILSKVESRMKALEWIRDLMDPLVRFLNRKANMTRDMNLKKVLTQIFSPTSSSEKSTPSPHPTPTPHPTTNSFNIRQPLANVTPLQLQARPQVRTTSPSSKAMLSTLKKDERPRKRMKPNYDEKENLSPFFLNHGPPRHGYTRR
uniref:Uncharacterized protein n=1 Tax=Moniliophthora roreri TaxID=221103 RepID=A0A0W0FFK7_MONRR